MTEEQNIFNRIEMFIRNSKPASKKWGELSKDRDDVELIFREIHRKGIMHELRLPSGDPKEQLRKLIMNVKNKIYTVRRIAEKYVQKDDRFQYKHVKTSSDAYDNDLWRVVFNVYNIEGGPIDGPTVIKVSLSKRSVILDD